MELKPGYKQTEVGVIPEDWEVAILAGVCSMKSGEGVTSADIDQFSKYPCYGGNGLRGFTTRFTHDGGYALIGRQGALCGNVVGVNGKFFASEHAIVVTASARTDIRWLTFVLGQMRLNQYSESSAQPGLSVSKLLRLNLASPPTKAEQEAIAEALSDADALIESLEQLIAKKRHLKQGAMQELLIGKKRLPGFSGKWEVKRLGDVAHIKTGSRNNQDKIEDGEYPFFVRSAAVERINSYSHECEAILIPGEGGIGSIFHYINGRFDVHQRVYAITQFTQDTCGKYVYFYLVKNFGAHATQNSVKATVDSLRLPTFQNFEIRMPQTVAEQTAIAAILSDMDAEITTLEAKLTKARQVKQGMMHNLLTGKIRLERQAIAKGEQHVPMSGDSVAKNTTEKPHNWAINEAVVISMLADRFGKPDFPLGRKRYTKLSYLLHRKAEREAQGYLKKAAGPYNPKTKYAGPEKIAQEKGYVRYHDTGKYKGFIAAENIEQAKAYFAKWYGAEIAAWLEQFRRSSNDELERLATVDMAMQELHRQGKTGDVAGVRALIASEPEWLQKLERTVFSDAGIAAAIAQSQTLFGSY